MYSIVREDQDVFGWKACVYVICVYDESLHLFVTTCEVVLLLSDEEIKLYSMRR